MDTDTDYTTLAGWLVLERLERIRQFIVVDGGSATEDHVGELREAFDTIVPLFQDIRAALSETSLAKAKAFAAAIARAQETKDAIIPQQFLGLTPGPDIPGLDLLVTLSVRLKDGKILRVAFPKYYVLEYREE